MSYKHLRSGLVKTRKGHRCRICDGEIPKGSKVYMFTGIDEEGFYTIYFHDLCREYSKDFDETDWEFSAPGSVSYSEVVEYMTTPQKENG